MSRRGRGGLRWALVASAVVHAGVIVLVLATASEPTPLPSMRVYAVDIVSPPPQEQGEYDPAPGGVAEPAPEPEPQPEPAPPPPAPAVEPSPPREATKKPEPVKRPEPAKPAPSKEAKPAEKPAEKPAPKPTGGTTKSAANTDKATPSRGARPEPSSPGGEGLDVQLKGAQCPSPDYCANIIRQLNRYFRPPAGSTTDLVEVFFYIERDGSIEDLRVVRSAGSVTFRLAAQEAVEQAGMNRAFGPLPRSFQLDRLPVSFYFRPAR